MIVRQGEKRLSGRGHIGSEWEAGARSLARAVKLLRIADDSEGTVWEAVRLAAEELGVPCAIYPALEGPPGRFDSMVYHPPDSWVIAALRQLPSEVTGGDANSIVTLPDLEIPESGRGVQGDAVDPGESLEAPTPLATPLSLLVVPIRHEHLRLGTLVCLAPRGNALGEADLAHAVVLSELIAMALKAQRVQSEQRRALKLRDMSISVASHELGNALATTRSLVQMSLRVIRRDDPDTVARVSHHLETMLRQVDWLTELTRDVFDQSRIDAGCIGLRRGPTSLNSVVVGVVERFQSVLAERPRHQLKVELPQTQLVGVWDRERIDQVVTNLLANAIKYSPAGGLLKVQVGRREGAGLRLEGGVDGCEGRSATSASAVVAVSDRGVGIPPGQLQSVFEPYFRASNVSKEISGGLGLGLHICKGIVESHGGEIWVESELGKGSTFYFSLPLEGIQ